jgi:glutamate synthase (NADPH/NADH) small chain
MDDLAFLETPRRGATYRPVDSRLQDYRDVRVARTEALSQQQAARCMGCATPYCHWACPLGNYVPDWNRALARGDWTKAFFALESTNSLPEITGRVCPALCESACVLNLGYEAVTNREDELAVVERAFASGIVTPQRPRRRTGKVVAVVGSGPAGLACAAQLNRAGHHVVVFERDRKPGGLLRYGIPDFKLEKWVIDRRVELMTDEGVHFVTETCVGRDMSARRVLKDFDAVCLAAGSGVARDLQVPGRELRGIHFATDYLAQANRRVAGERIMARDLIVAKGKRVVVLGGGDTGADCVGTALRQGAADVIQLELLPQPPTMRNRRDYWPDYPPVLRTSSSHEEGGRRAWSIRTQEFLGQHDVVDGLRCVKVRHGRDPHGRPATAEVPGTEFELEADLVLLALGFLSTEPALLSAFEVAADRRGNASTGEDYRTSVPRVYSAGDMRRGPSLVVWAVSEGRRAAHYIDRDLMGRSDLRLL